MVRPGTATPKPDVVENRFQRRYSVIGMYALRTEANGWKALSFNGRSESTSWNVQDQLNVVRHKRFEHLWRRINPDAGRTRQSICPRHWSSNVAAIVSRLGILRVCCLWYNRRHCIQRCVATLRHMLWTALRVNIQLPSARWILRDLIPRQASS